MDRIDVMRLFARIVERRSFAQASKDLQVPRATATHAIQRLEAELGVRLLDVLRAGELPDSSLVGRRLTAFKQVSLASPAYLDRYGTPANLNDLQGHRMVAYTASATGQAYRWSSKSMAN